LSKNISQEEARLGMRAILQGHIEPIQIGIFLIALRMKRETDDENCGILSGIQDLTQSVVADVPEVIDLADPYDGYNRTLPPTPFLPAVLAACGVAAVCHGMETVSPKFGVTHKQILRTLGIPVELPIAEAAKRLAQPELGWAYVDQSQFCPPLHDLTELRTKMVKRSAITTVEVLTAPLRGREKTHLVTGYVHKPYPRIYALLARHAGFDSALIVRGIEGGVIPSLRQAGKFFYYHDRGAEESIDIDPVDLGIQQELRAVPVPETLNAEGEEIPLDTAIMAHLAAEHGVAALKGQKGATYDALVYSGAVCLWHLRRHESLNAAATQVRQVLDNGSALSRLLAAGAKL
jgi:anthranilate phosphoribosyltransferase